jgi:hypothetical protein
MRNLNLVLAFALFLTLTTAVKYEATDSIMVSKFLSDHRHSYDIIALLFMRSQPTEEEKS